MQTCRFNVEDGDDKTALFLEMMLATLLLLRLHYGFVGVGRSVFEQVFD